MATMAVSLSACRITDMPLWKLDADGAAVAHLERARGIAYVEGKDADSVRHRLDLYVPPRLMESPRPVVMLVHGGGWMTGDNRCCGLYSSVAEYLASQGFVVAAPNYRLSPEVKHPEHIRDVARAFAWVRGHASEYGGDPKSIFLVGHSAGGHLVSLLATDEQYLREVGCEIADICGVVSVSGIYKIADGDVEGELGGLTKMSAHVSDILPVRGPAGNFRFPLGVPLKVNFYGVAFGDDAKVRAAASPLTHVKPGLPPFLLLNAEKELPTLNDMTKEFREALFRHGNDVRTFEIAERNHNSILFAAIDSKDATARLIRDFVRRHAH
ncbi:MAG: alpha/beta hydrolase [Gemmataceae bacterium]